MSVHSRYVPVDLSGRRAVVAGAGIAGLAAALALGERGAEVLLVDADEAPPGRTAGDVFGGWGRRKVPQFRHSHAFLARVRNILHRSYPDVYQRLLDEGAMEIRLLEHPPGPIRPLAPEPGDEELAALGCRRSTFEWVLRHAVEEKPWCESLSGTTVTGLCGRNGTGVPEVTGVRIRSDHGRERTIDTDIVVDATGRNTRSPRWLRDLGARAPVEERSSSSILYYTRFYRLRPGADYLPPGEEPSMADWGWLKFAVFPADNRTFSITFATPVALPRMKVLAEPEPFDHLVRSIPGLAPWADPGTSEPLPGSPRGVLAMGGLENCRRRFVDTAGRPLATGFFAIGDSAYHTNPLYGRGCTQAFLHAGLLGEALDAAAGDTERAATFLDDFAREWIEPFYEASVLADQGAARKAEAFVDGREHRRGRFSLGRLWDSFFERGVLPAGRVDPQVYRAFVRMFNMMETPNEAFLRPDILGRIVSVWLRPSRQRLWDGSPALDFRTTLEELETVASDAKERSFASARIA